MHHSRHLTPSQQQSHKQDAGRLKTEPDVQPFYHNLKAYSTQPHHKRARTTARLGRKTLGQEKEGEALRGRPELKPVWVTASLESNSDAGSPLKTCDSTSSSSLEFQSFKAKN